MAKAGKNDCAVGRSGELACPLDGIVHWSIFHVAPVFVAGLIGRFVVPPLLRW